LVGTGGFEPPIS